MKKILLSMLAILISFSAFAQIDKEQLSLDVSKAEAANTEKLKAFIWKRHGSATVDGEVKSTVINELSFNDAGEIEVQAIDAQTTVKQKRGVRGKIQQSAMENNADYVGQALELALAYTYMSKGQLLDFFDKAKITDSGTTYTVAGSNVYLEGDELTVVVEKATNLFLTKTFSSKLGEDPVSGEIKYEKFSSGINHGSTTVINLPAKNAVINAKNQDYTQRVQ